MGAEITVELGETKLFGLKEQKTNAGKEFSVENKIMNSVRVSKSSSPASPGPAENKAVALLTLSGVKIGCKNLGGPH